MEKDQESIKMMIELEEPFWLRILIKLKIISFYSYHGAFSKLPPLSFKAYAIEYRFTLLEWLKKKYRKWKDGKACQATFFIHVPEQMSEDTICQVHLKNKSFQQ